MLNFWHVKTLYVLIHVLIFYIQQSKPLMCLFFRQRLHVICAKFFRKKSLNVLNWPCAYKKRSVFSPKTQTAIFLCFVEIFFHGLTPCIYVVWHKHTEITSKYRNSPTPVPRVNRVLGTILHFDYLMRKYWWNYENPTLSTDEG